MACAKVRFKYFFRLCIGNLFANLRFIFQKREYDIVFIMQPKSQDWILGAICREIAKYWPGTSYVHYNEGRLPKARVYFLSHFSLIKPGFTKYPQLHFSKTFSFYTHPDKRNLGMVNCELAFWLNRVTANIFQGKIFHKRNLAIGLRPEKITTIYGGGDPEFIRGHERSGDGVVGFSTAYYKRKDPELIYNIIKNMPHREFILLGKNWQEYEKFEEMKEMKNFTYIDTEYKNYPDYYDKMTVFVSASKREGGPISLIEAMMANIVPVASNTGFAPDLIRQGKNGFIFPENSKTEDVIKLIDKAFDLKTDIRESIKEHTWQKFSEEIYKLSIKEA